MNLKTAGGVLVPEMEKIRNYGAFDFNTESS